MSEQIKTLDNALLGAFNPFSFDQMLSYQLGKTRAHFANGSFNEVVYDTIMTAQREGWLAKLVEGARKENPDNRKLKEAADLFAQSPELFEMPDSDLPLPTEDTSSTADTQSGGTAVGRDLHEGDTITVGDISGSTGIAIGRGASASVSINYGSSSEQAKLDSLLQELEKALTTLTTSQPDDAANLQDEINDLRKELAEPAPTARRVKKYSTRLHEAALKFATSMPAILATADKVVDLVQKIGR